MLALTFARVMLWENQIRRFRDRQNLYVIWILWRFGNEVKSENPSFKYNLQAVVKPGLTVAAAAV